MPFPSPGDLPDPGIALRSPALQADSLPYACKKSHQGTPSKWKMLASFIPEKISSVSSVQLLSQVQLSVTPWTAARQASLSITNSRRLFKLMFIESVMPSNHLILCNPLLLPPSIFPSIRVFSNESVYTSGAKVMEFQLQHQSFQ